VLVAALTVVMVVGQLIVTRAGEARGGRRPLVVSGVVLAALWIQTLIDQVFGFGNLGDVLFGSGGAGRAGLRAGARMVAAGLISPHMLTRPGYRAFDADMGFATLWQSIVFWLAVVLAVVWAVRTIRTRGWRSGAGLVVALVAVLAGVLDAAMLPETAFGFEVMNYRWLWPTAAFIAMLLLIGAQRWLAARHDRASRPAHDWFGIVALAVCAATAVANLPRSVQNDGADRYFADQHNVEIALDELDPALDSIAAHGPIVIDESQMYFGHPYTYPVLVAMQSHGIDFRFEEPRQERRFGTRRVSDGTETQRLKMVAGQPALDARDNPSTIAFVDGQIPVAFVVEPT
jgi:hypothetical protein